MNKIIKILIFIAIIIVIALAGFFLWPDTAIDGPGGENNQTGEIKSMGIIEGSLSYPSEVIPELIICAEDINNDQQYCTTEQIEDEKYTYSKGYKLEVPVGKYFVFAQREDNDRKAYYSEYVICGIRADCPSHKPVVVTVDEGETVSEVDPHDWYIKN